MRARPAGRPRAARLAGAAPPAGGGRRPGRPAAPPVRGRPGGPGPGPFHGGQRAAGGRVARHRAEAALRIFHSYIRHNQSDPRHGGALRDQRVGGGQPGQLPHSHRRGEPARPRAAHGTLPVRGPQGTARHRRGRGVGAAARLLPGDPRPIRREPGGLRVHDGDLPCPQRHPRRRGGHGPAAARDRRHRQGVPAHQGQAIRAALSDLPELRDSGLDDRRAGDDVPPRREARRPAPAHRPAPLRHPAVRLRAARPHPRRAQRCGVPA